MMMGQGLGVAGRLAQNKAKKENTKIKTADQTAYQTLKAQMDQSDASATESPKRRTMDADTFRTMAKNQTKAIQTFRIGGQEVWTDINGLDTGAAISEDGRGIFGAGLRKEHKVKKDLIQLKMQKENAQTAEEKERIEREAWKIINDPRNDNKPDAVERFDYRREIWNRPMEYYTEIPDVTERILGLAKEEEKRPQTGGYTATLPVDLARFAERYRTNGPMDIKNWDEFQQHDLFIFDGELVSRDALGNILYGYAGKAAGFPEWMLKAAGGLVQVASKSSDWNWYNSYFDDPRDQKRIQQGFDLYKQIHGN